MTKNISKAELIKSVATDSNLSEKQAQLAVNSVLKQIGLQLANEKRINFKGVGTFRNLITNEMVRYHPVTRKPIKVPQKKQPKFVFSELLKRQVAQEAQKRDHRELERREFIFDLPVVNCDDHSTVGNVGDITPFGLLVNSEKKMKKNKSCHFKILFPETIVDQTEWVVKAKCVWCRESKVEDDYQIGFRLQNISISDREIIEELLNEYAV